MKRVLYLFVILYALLAVVAASAQPEPLSEQDWAAIRRVINAQIEAFERDDAEVAFSYASPALRELFKTPERFIAMVRQNYAAVYRPRAVTFLEPSVVDELPVQPVQVLAPDGSVVVAIYSMQRQGLGVGNGDDEDGNPGNGDWKILGCQLVPLKAVFAQAEPGRLWPSITDRVSHRLAALTGVRASTPSSRLCG